VEVAAADVDPLPRPLVVADIGCRWGIPQRWAESPGQLRVFAFDADPAECARLQATAPPNVTYVGTALGDRDGQARLYLTEDPACSSLFPPATEVLALFPELEAATPTGTRDIAVRTFDGWAQEAGVAEVDVLKLDVQGAELSVLRGAQRLLSTVRIIEAEVTFNPIYTGQPLFGEVDAYLRERGFVLWRLGHLVHYTSQAQREATIARSDCQFFDSKPVAFPVGGGQVTWGHAYYCARRLIHGNWTDAATAGLDARAADLFEFGELVEPALASARSLASPREGRCG
jgi:FkbM family methyltransferase